MNDYESEKYLEESAIKAAMRALIRDRNCPYVPGTKFLLRRRMDYPIFELLALIKICIPGT